MANVEAKVQHPCFEERLWVPWWWWPFAAVLVVIFAAEVVPGLPTSWQVISVVAITAVIVSWLLTVGHVRVGVDPEGLRAGSAKLPYSAIGAVRLVERDTRRALLSHAGDHKSFLQTRDWVRGTVYVEVADDNDETPYWLLSTRHPERLAAALRRADDDGPLSF